MLLGRFDPTDRNSKMTTSLTPCDGKRGLLSRPFLFSTLHLGPSDWGLEDKGWRWTRPRVSSFGEYGGHRPGVECIGVKVSPLERQ